MTRRVLKPKQTTQIEQNVAPQLLLITLHKSKRGSSDLSFIVAYCLELIDLSIQYTIALTLPQNDAMLLCLCVCIDVADMTVKAHRTCNASGYWQNGKTDYGECTKVLQPLVAMLQEHDIPVSIWYTCTCISTSYHDFF